jgi:hypothetical protein
MMIYKYIYFPQIKHLPTIIFLPSLIGSNIYQHFPVSSRSLLLLVVLLGSVELGSSLLTGTISGPTGNCVTWGMNEDDSPDAIGTFVMCGIRGGIPYDAL